MRLDETGCNFFTHSWETAIHAYKQCRGSLTIVRCENTHQKHHRQTNSAQCQRTFYFFLTRDWFLSGVCAGDCFRRTQWREESGPSHPIMGRIRLLSFMDKCRAAEHIPLIMADKTRDIFLCRTGKRLCDLCLLNQQMSDCATLTTVVWPSAEGWGGSAGPMTRGWVRRSVVPSLYGLPFWTGGINFKLNPIVYCRRSDDNSCSRGIHAPEFICIGAKNGNW